MCPGEVVFGGLEGGEARVAPPTLSGSSSDSRFNPFVPIWQGVGFAASQLLCKDR